MKRPPAQPQNALDKSDIQGIIGSGYAHLDYMAYYFVHFTELDGAQAWLGAVTPRIQTAQDWAVVNGKKQKPLRTWNIAITYKGMEALAMPQDLLKTFSTQYREGMYTNYRVKDVLGDFDESAPEHWDIGGPKNADDPNTIHALVICYATHDTTDAATADGDPLESSISEGEAWLQDLCDTHAVNILHTEYGFRDGWGREPFGFRDGISNPQIEGIHTPLNNTENYNCVRTGEFILGYYNEYQQLATTPITKHDPHNLLQGFNASALADYRDFGRNGTYLVYRKLHQHVVRFWQFMQQQTINEDGTADTEAMHRLAAKFVGRWLNGKPLTLSPDKETTHHSDDRDFLYMATDADGYRCPFSSHIRRANPRDSFVEDDMEQSIANSKIHRIMRRASIYGDPLVTDAMVTNGNIPVVGDNLEVDIQPRGIHFFSVNADIHRQFEFVQQAWCNNPRFNHIYNSKDPIIGSFHVDKRVRGFVEYETTEYVSINHDPISERIHNFQRFVDTRGGEYFFLPSIAALQYMAAGV